MFIFIYFFKKVFGFHFIFIHSSYAVVSFLCDLVKLRVFVFCPSHASVLYFKVDSYLMDFNKRMGLSYHFLYQLSQSPSIKVEPTRSTTRQGKFKICWIYKAWYLFIPFACGRYMERPVLNARKFKCSEM